MKTFSKRSISSGHPFAATTGQPADHRSGNKSKAIENLFPLALFAMLLAPLTSAAATPARLPDGMFSTKGNQIVDKNHNPVRLSCVYWPGLNHQDGPWPD